MGMIMRRTWYNDECHVRAVLVMISHIKEERMHRMKRPSDLNNKNQYSFLTETLLTNSS